MWKLIDVLGIDRTRRITAIGLSWRQVANAVNALRGSTDRASRGMLGLGPALLSLLTPAQQRREAKRLVRETIQERRLAGCPTRPAAGSSWR